MMHRSLILPQLALSLKKIIFVLLVSGSFIAPAKAELKICNYVDNIVNIAIGYKVKSGWTTAGWWVIKPNACEVVIESELYARYYYLYAIEEGTGGYWQGDAIMCTSNKSFIINGITNCDSRGYRRTGFYEMDTGDGNSWTLKLTPDN